MAHMKVFQCVQVTQHPEQVRKESYFFAYQIISVWLQELYDGLQFISHVELDTVRIDIAWFADSLARCVILRNNSPGWSQREIINSIFNNIFEGRMY